MSRSKLISIGCILAVIAAAFYGYSLYLHNIKVFSIDKTVKFADITVEIDEALLSPRFMFSEPFHRELTVKGKVTDMSKDGKYTKNLSELIKVYVEDSPGMGFSQDAKANYYRFWTYKTYNGNKTIDLIIDNRISKQKVPLKIDLRD